MTTAPASTLPEPVVDRRKGTTRRRIVLLVRLALLAGVGYVGVLIVSSNSAELSGATASLASARWEWILPAIGAEVLSYLAFTQLQRRLLAAARVKTGLGKMAAITMAGNSMNNSLPGGGAFATVFAYRQFRRLGADEGVTAWTLVAFTALTSVALALMALAGLIIAGPNGPVGGLWPVIPVLIIGPIAAVVVLLRPRVLRLLLLRPVMAVRRVTGFPRRDPTARFERLVGQLEEVAPRRGDWAVALFYSVANWGTDCFCLVLAFVAVGTHVPWRLILLAYGAAQVAANLPITPGGLGVVEGSLTIGLTTFGGSSEGTIAAVLLYRIISFWAPLPIGWLSWIGLQIQERRAAS